MRLIMLFTMLLLPSLVLAQIPSRDFTDPIVDIVTNPQLQGNALDPAIVNRTVDLEQELMSTNPTPECLEDIAPNMTCEDLRESLLPGQYKESGWRVLFEARYQPESEYRGNLRNRGTGQEMFWQRQNNVNNFYSVFPEGTMSTPADLELEAQRIAENYPGRTKEDFYGALILRQLQKTNNYDEMMSKFRQLSANLTDQQYLQFLSTVGGWADYNDDRAAFIQEEGAGLGRVGPFEQIIGTSSGVCGDIHSMVAKFAEQRGWESFTVGYALEGMQHVVTAVVDPNNRDRLMVVNYGNYEEQALNDGNSIIPVPTDGMNEMGMQLRIFKNNASNGGDGGMQQIATIPTPLGSFMNTLFQRQGQIQGAMPDNENFRRTQAGFEFDRHSTTMRNNGGVRDRLASEGIVIYEGEVDNAQVYGIAVSHNVFNKIYGYDPRQRKCVERKSRYFSVGVAGSLVNLPQDGLFNNYYVYLNMKGGQIINIFQTKHFVFKGLIGYELEGFVSFTNDGSFLTADGNLATFAGVMAEYQRNNTALYAGVRLETNVGLRDQNLMNDFSALPENIAPFSFNALRTDFGLQQRLNDRMTFVTDNSLIVSRVGNRVILSTGVIMNNTSIMLSYQGGMGRIPLGNSLQNVNLLQNFNSMDGARLTIGQNFSMFNGAVTGNANIWGGISTSTSTPQGMGGVGVRINLNGGSNRRRTPSGR